MLRLAAFEIRAVLLQKFGRVCFEYDLHHSCPDNK